MADIYVFTEEGISIENFRPKKGKTFDGDEGGGGEGPAILGSGQEEEGEEEEDEEESDVERGHHESHLSCSSDSSLLHEGERSSSSGDYMTRTEYEDSPRLGGGGDGDEDDEGSIEDYDDDDGENLNPLTTLLRLAKSSDFHDGEVVIRSLHETLQYVIDSPKDIKTVLDVITSLSTNSEPVLRTDLMEQVPQIAFLCHDHPQKLGGLVAGTLIPMVVKFLTDPNDLVRKTSQAALLVLLEQELVSHKDVNDQVCPIVLDLTEPDAIDYFKTEAVALMSKMAPLVGREMTERLFLQRFTRLCSDTLFQVRKVCAANFGELSGVVGTEGTENVLLPYFLNLCEDGVWGVRKACADVFMVVSCACSLETRKTRLAPLFVSLLSDDSRWVRLAAFQNLGPFISTFADPNATGLHYNMGVLFIGTLPEDGEPTPKLDADNIITSDPKRVESQEADEEMKKIADAEDNYQLVWSPEQMKLIKVPLEEDTENSSGSSFHPREKGKQSSSGDSVRLMGFEPAKDDPVYNELNYWRVPLPDVDLEDLLQDLSLIEEKEEVQEDLLKEKEEEVSNEDSPKEKEEEKDEEEVNLSDSLIKPERVRKTLLSAYTHENYGYEENEHFGINKNKGKPMEQNETISGKVLPNTGAGSEEEESSVSSSSLAFELEEKCSISEPSRMTYAEVCASSLQTALDKEQISNVKTEDEESDAKPDNKEKEESIVRTETAEDSYLLGPFDCSKSMHNLSFSNISALSGSKVADPYLNKFKYNNSSDKFSFYHDTHNVFQNININVKQDIVPKTLLEHYISMTDPMRAETVDDEITRHCAYSLPAVALTLGRRYWPVLRETYETLATDMHWKVRRTLAFSIHELAVILGEELTQKDLLPVFEGFIKDLDEVRIGVLKHLSIFLKMLPPSPRKLFLPRLSEFLNPDNVNNWRFRLELALQLAPIAEMFTPEECWIHICPIIFDLMADKVVEIRRTCFSVISQLAKKLHSDDDTSLIVPFSQKLIEEFAQADTWTKRQSYAYVVGQIIGKYSLPLPVVCSLFLPKFLELARDKVANIRLVVARIINSDFLTLDCPQDDLLLSVRETLHILQNDTDRDVHYFASSPGHSSVPEETQDTNFY